RGQHGLDVLISLDRLRFDVPRSYESPLRIERNLAGREDQVADLGGVRSPSVTRKAPRCLVHPADRQLLPAHFLLPPFAPTVAAKFAAAAGEAMDSGAAPRVCDLARRPTVGRATRLPPRAVRGGSPGEQA